MNVTKDRETPVIWYRVGRKRRRLCVLRGRWTFIFLVLSLEKRGGNIFLIFHEFLLKLNLKSLFTFHLDSNKVRKNVLWR
jgi:hypothetical protein